MQNFETIIHNKILLVSLLACFSAQSLKFLIELIHHRKMNFNSLVSTGGMPSAHSALVGSLATSIGLTEGWESSEFAITCLFAIIVMYDATGIRQAAGKQAQILNQLIDSFRDYIFSLNTEERLKELLGHTPVQVLVGLGWGIWISVLAITIF